MLEVEDYKSVRNWFSRKEYKPSTKRMYIKRMKIWCELTQKTPDELASVEDIGKMRGIIGERLLEKFEREKRTVIFDIVKHWINSLNSFWKYNGRQVEGKYDGIPKHLRKDIRKLKKYNNRANESPNR